MKFIAGFTAPASLGPSESQTTLYGLLSESFEDDLEFEKENFGEPLTPCRGRVYEIKPAVFSSSWLKRKLAFWR
jgi:hypothetical protein